jgi:hypothetical protein
MRVDPRLRFQALDMWPGSDNFRFEFDLRLIPGRGGAVQAADKSVAGFDKLDLLSHALFPLTAETRQ